MSTYGNLKTDIVITGGGSSTVTISGTTGQGSDVECRYCRIQSRSGNATARVRIGSTCSSTTGVAIPGYPTLTPYAIDNLNKLYFYGTAGNVIDIEYFT